MLTHSTEFDVLERLKIQTLSRVGVPVEEVTQYWKKCSTCKKSIDYGAKYFTCSVSTCNGQRTGYIFCGIGCFESHLPGARHRDAGAIEQRSPSRTPQRTIVRTNAVGAPVGAAQAPTQLPKEVLVIASRLKEYILAKSDFNTSASVMDLLSEHLRMLCDRAIDEARTDGRKTVMDRDFKF